MFKDRWTTGWSAMCVCVVDVDVRQHFIRFFFRDFFFFFHTIMRMPNPVNIKRVPWVLKVPNALYFECHLNMYQVPPPPQYQKTIYTISIWLFCLMVKYIDANIRESFHVPSSTIECRCNDNNNNNHNNGFQAFWCFRTFLYTLHLKYVHVSSPKIPNETIPHDLRHDFNPILKIY